MNLLNIIVLFVLTASVTANPLFWDKKSEEKPNLFKSITQTIEARKLKPIEWTTLTEEITEDFTLTLPVLPNITTIFKRDVPEAEVTEAPTQEIPEQYLTQRPDIFEHYGVHLENFNNPQQAVSIARGVSSKIILAKATPTYNAKLVLSEVFKNVPQPTSHNLGDLIDDIKDGHAAVDNLLTSIIKPFLSY